MKNHGLQFLIVKKKIDDLRADENTDKKFLNDYYLFIQDLESQHKTNL